MPDLATVENGEIRLRLHPGQVRAWESTARVVCIIAGTQGGKTSYGPHWFAREIRDRGPGDYMIVTPTFQLLEKKLLPEFLKTFQQWLKLGTFYSHPSRKFVFSPDGDRRLFGRHLPDERTTIWFGHADDPESLESATVKAVWADEAGQKRFRLQSWEALNRRVAVHQGRILITTTPYDLGWLKRQVYDRWKAGDPRYEVIRFDSTENPAFPREEYQWAKETLPRWKFLMFYRGIFTRPAGMIYDAFVDEYAPQGHKIRRFAVPDHWRRYLGLDFGGANTAGIHLAEDPRTERLIAYREYHAGARTAAEHVAELLKGEPEGSAPFTVGGSHSEGQWRREFHSGGLKVREPPIRDVEVGIERVYACFRKRELLVMDDLAGLLDEVLTYSRVLTESGEPTEKIEDKNAYHRLDALRYIIAYIRRNERPVSPASGGKAPLVEHFNNPGSGYLIGRIR